MSDNNSDSFLEAEYREEDALEGRLRPQRLKEFQGQRALKENLSVLYRRRRNGRKAWIMFFFQVPRDWEKRPLPEFSPMRWAPNSR